MNNLNSQNERLYIKLVQLQTSKHYIINGEKKSRDLRLFISTMKTKKFDLTYCYGTIPSDRNNGTKLTGAKPKLSSNIYIY